MVSFFSDPDITNAITGDSLENLKRALNTSYDNLHALAITKKQPLYDSPSPRSWRYRLLGPCDDRSTCSQLVPSLGTLITECNLDINIDLDQLGTFLILCTKRNDVDQVRTLLSYRADPN
ncbi:MAG: hypothetical protein Q9219_007659 [cf. Caloplaca sp. 3 TL-2023]